MNSQDIQIQLEESERKLSVLKLSLDKIVENFRHELPSLAETWMRSEVDRRIKGNPEKVQKLGIERLRELKQGLTDLVGRLPEIALKETEDRTDWPHHRVQGASVGGRGENEPFFDKAFRSTISHVASLLQPFGLLTEPSGHIQVWEDKGSGRYRYGINPGFMDMPVPSRTSFYVSSKELDALMRQVEKLQTDLAQAKAKELWESA